MQSSDALVKALDDHQCGCGGPCGQQTPAYIRDAAQRIEEMRRALEPFSDMAGELFARGWDANNVALALDNPGDLHRVTAGDFFAARAALQSKDRPDATE